MLRLVAVAGSAVLVGAAVWGDVAAQARYLWDGAGWWSVAMLAWPAFVGFAAWRWGR